MDFFNGTIPAFFQDILGNFSIEFVFMFAVALVLSSVGFIKVVFFISIGYGLSIAGMAVLSLILFRDTLDPLVVLQAVFLGVYGLRLGIYLLRRETSPGYRKAMTTSEYGTFKPGIVIKLFMWLSVALLYVIMFSPCLLNFLHARIVGAAVGLPAATIIGLIIIISGLLLEGVADAQKSRFKHRNPGRFCDTGLYRLVRCPNYLGEMVFWTGNWSAGIPAYTAWPHWVISVTGLAVILLIMIGSTRRLELSQDKRYAGDDRYKAYAGSVPVLFPGLPVYSLKNWKVYLG